LAKSEILYSAHIIGLSLTTVTQSASKAMEFDEIMQNKGYYTAQGYRCRYQWKAHMRLPIIDNTN